MYGFRSSSLSKETEAYTPQRVTAALKEGMSKGRNASRVSVGELRSAYDFVSFLKATELKGHGHRRHVKASVFLDIHAKANDVHSCEIKIAGPESMHYDATRPRKAVARFRSRNYGHAP